MENIEIARVLRDLADLFEIKGSNPFRIRAYRNAAEVVEANEEPMREMVEAGADLTGLPAIGKDMARHIEELVRVGKSSTLEELAKEVPLTLIELTHLPGLGAKRAKKLWEQLDVTTIDELERAATSGGIESLAGFGKKTQATIVASIERYRRHRERTKIDDADRYVVPIVERLSEHPAVQRIHIVGSLRRRCERVGDIDLLAVTAEPEAVVERFARLPNLRRIEAHSHAAASGTISSGLRVDLNVVLPEASGAALVYLTGSRQHNARICDIAESRDVGLSEMFCNELSGDMDTAARVAGPTEEEIYEILGLGWIAPELREDRGEVEAASLDKLPELVTMSDIRGDLQMHSTWSDGKETIEGMLEACAERGYDYFAITDHSQALAMTGGLDAARLRQQWVEIDVVAERHPEVKILRGMEVDILADGRLDLEDEMLAALDLVLASVHSRFDLPAATQTDRITKALRHPEVNILAHPTGRQINRRDPMRFDLDTVLECAAEHNVAVELNAHPNRLDLSDVQLMRAKELGLKIVISTDAHSAGDLDLMKYGVEQARRAWLGKNDVINTLEYHELLAALAIEE
ncbi:MAG: DNA polymerase/3'-5' exonuclease PolX [Gemmatimonadales bacterium]